MMNHLSALTPTDIDNLPLYRWEEYKRLVAKLLKDKAEAQRNAESEQKSSKPSFKMPSFKMPRFR